jgi:hypothetical protein
MNFYEKVNINDSDRGDSELFNRNEAIEIS